MFRAQLRRDRADIFGVDLRKPRGWVLCDLGAAGRSLRGRTRAIGATGPCGRNSHERTVARHLARPHRVGVRRRVFRLACSFRKRYRSDAGAGRHRSSVSTCQSADLGPQLWQAARLSLASDCRAARSAPSGPDRRCAIRRIQHVLVRARVAFGQCTVSSWSTRHRTVRDRRRSERVHSAAGGQTVRPAWAARCHHDRDWNDGVVFPGFLGFLVEHRRPRHRRCPARCRLADRANAQRVAGLCIATRSAQPVEHDLHGVVFLRRGDRFGRWRDCLANERLDGCVSRRTALLCRGGSEPPPGPQFGYATC